MNISRDFFYFDALVITRLSQIYYVLIDPSCQQNVVVCTWEISFMQRHPNESHIPKVCSHQRHEGCPKANHQRREGRPKALLRMWTTMQVQFV